AKHNANEGRRASLLALQTHRSSNKSSEVDPEIGVSAVQNQFEMLQRPILFLLSMYRPLEGNVVVRSHFCEPRKRRVQCLEIHEAEWIFQTSKLFFELRANERLATLCAIDSPALSLSQRKGGGNSSDCGDSRRS